MSNPNDYTVGWICALSTEYVAAQAFLDEKYDDPESVAYHDNNDYTLGRIKDHKVVIAVLPDGEYGIASAANVAKDLLHSFPNVRIGLLVGIGGGAPSESHDIRLGDVVVSSSRNGTGGIFQYDFGTTVQNQSFLATGFLNQPPALLRTATSGLKSQYESDGHQYEATISNIFKKKLRLRKKYSRPDHSTDILYRSDVIHPLNASKASCKDTCGNETAKIILRSEREDDEDNPAIHYGLIASANQLMKDAMVRDRLAAEKEILCFETEAAGLMNQFPCLVIRGICDYSDSHENKEWQGYAAMTAAAYAKDLLYRIPPKKVEAEKRIGDILSQVNENVSYIKSEMERSEDDKLLNWITPVEYGPQQSDYMRERQAGTGQWLLDSEEYKTWLSTDNQTLFCPGIPGAGKTILCAVVIDDITAQVSSNPNIGLAYVYCNFKRKDEQKFEDLISSLLKQLSRKRSSLPEVIKDLHDKHHKERTRPSADELVKALHSVAAMYSKVIMIIDALDECETSSRSKLLTYILSFPNSIVANLFATSRHIPDIEKQFRESLRREIIANDEDVSRYMNANTQDLPDFLSSKPDRIAELITEIIQAAQGMFLLVKLYLDSLKDKTSISEAKSVLSKIKSRNKTQADGAIDHALTLAYTDAMERINYQGQSRRSLGKKVISWITCAKRPLGTLELRHALAVNIGDIALDTDNVRDVDIMVSVCAGLVTVDEKSGIIRLVHYTTQEYFDRTQSDWFPDAETEITRICCTYLSFSIFSTGFCETAYTFQERLQSNPLYKYAAANWGHHARSISDIPDEVTNFLLCRKEVEAAMQRRFRRLFRRRFRRRDKLPWLHLAAFFGIQKAVDFLTQGEQDLDLRDTYRMTPLAYAVKNGHQDTVRLLLEKGAAVDRTGYMNQTPLLIAINNGHEQIVRLLLGKDATVEAKDEQGQTPLCQAIENNHENIVRLLLDKGALIEKRGRYGHKPLGVAVEAANEDIIRLLLEKGSEINTNTQWRITPLCHAIENNYRDIVRLLLDKGALIEGKDGSNKTPLIYAVKSGDEDVVRLLLEEGARVNTTTRSERTPLMYAVKEEQENVVRMLLEKGAAINAKDASGQTALILATKSGNENINENIIRLLLEKGCSIEERDSDGNTPLMHATKLGTSETMLFFLEKGADIEATNERGDTTLIVAASKSQNDNIKLLLDRGAEIETKNNKGQTALIKAASKSQNDNIKLLLDRGAEIETKNNKGQTALIIAVLKSQYDNIKLLLNRGADIKIKDNRERTPLMISISQMGINITQLLLDGGAALEARDATGRTALMLAVISNERAIIKLLLDRGAAIEARDGNGKTALIHAAESFNHDTAAIKLLLKRGAAIEARDGNGKTALIHAAESFNHDTAAIKLLLKRGAAIEARDGNGKTALIHAAESFNHDTAAIKLLLKRGAATKARDNDGRDALSYALEQGNKDELVKCFQNSIGFGWLHTSTFLDDGLLF
ncbi:ankyrin repeat-containing domain protein [Trichoderma chlorosporum]